MFTVLSAYIEAACLLKLAKLTDEEFAKVLHTPKLRDLVKDTGLLDEFYKAMPNMSERGIDEALDEIDRDKAALGGKKEIDEETREFLHEFGDRQFDAFLVRYLQRYAEQAKEISIDAYNELVNYFLTKTIGDFILDCVKTKMADDTDLFMFIEYYRAFLRHKGNQNNGMTQEAAKELFRIMYILIIKSNMKIEMMDTMQEKYELAKKLRQSDMFDFILSEDLTKEKIEQVERAPISSKPDVKIDYSVEAPTAPTRK